MTLNQQILEDVASHAKPWGDAMVLMSQFDLPMDYRHMARRMEALGELAGSAKEDAIHGEFADLMLFVKTALIVQIANAPPAEEDQDDAAYWRHELHALDRVNGQIIMASQAAAVEAALLSACSLQVALEDWRLAGGTIPGAGEPAIAAPLSMSIEAIPFRLDLAVSDGRTISVELEGGDLRILAFNEMKDEPMLVKIPVDSVITVGIEDYQAGPVITDDSPAP